MSARPRDFFVDGSGLVYRAFFALMRNPLVTSKGENVSAVHGFLTTLLRLLREERPDEIAVAFDVKGPTFRHETYPQYKANRPPLPPELGLQIPRTKDLLDTMGVVRCEVPGLEADDVIGSLTRRALEREHDVVIVSADKDFMQLIRPGVLQWIPPKMQEPGQWVDAEGVRARWGVLPGQMIDLLALMGDASDNVPGVAGVGEKTAAQLLQQFGSLEDIYKDLDRIPQKGLRAKLEAGRENAFLSRDLVRIREDLDSAVLPGEAPVPDLNHRPGFLGALESLEFRRVIESLGLRETRTWETSTELLDAPGSLTRWMGEWRARKQPLAIWSEMRGQELLGVALASEAGTTAYVPLAHAVPPNADQEELKRELSSALEAPGTELIGYDLKATLHRLSPFGIEAKAQLRDLLLASYLVDSEGSHTLETLAGERGGHTLIPEADLLGTGKHRLTFGDLDARSVAPLVGEKVDVVLRLSQDLRPLLIEQEALSLWEDLEGPLVQVLQRMEAAGIGLDTKFLGALSIEMETDLARLTEEIHRLAGGPFNIGSPQQLGEVLFERLRLPKRKKTKTGYSTDHEVLEALAEYHPVPKLVLEHRTLSKLKGTYVDSLPGLVDPRDGRIHATFHQAVAATGRLSSSDPNIQNIPIRSESGRRIRQAFVAEKGSVLLSADYSQVELRILAHLSEDESLQQAFREGADVHTTTAMRLFGVPRESVGIELRSRAKAINFGVIYGMGPQRISREMGVSLLEAKSFIEDYFGKMPAVRAYLEKNLAFAKKHGYVKTILGRRRYLRGITSDDMRARAQAERIAANTPIQGSAADVIKLAMLAVDRELRHSPARLLLQVHDELVVETPIERAAEVSALVQRCMRDAIELAVPLHVEIGQGISWATAHP